MNNEDNMENTFRMMVVPKGLQHMIMDEYHSAPYMAHLGIHKTIARIKKYYWWRGLMRSVTKYVLACKECARAKGTPLGRTQMQHTRIPAYPMEVITIDLIGPFPESLRGYKYIQCIQCHLTDYIFLSPLKQSTAEDCAEAYVNHVYSKIGASKTIVTDNDPRFRSLFFRAINRLLGMETRYVLPYRPQSNGKNERSHQTIVAAIKMFISREDQRDWDSYLNLIALGYNSAIKVESGYSPFNLVYTFECRFPLETMLGLQIMKNEPWMNRKDVKNWRLQRQIIIRKTIDFIRELTFKLQNKRIEKYEQ